MKSKAMVLVEPKRLGMQGFEVIEPLPVGQNTGKYERRSKPCY